MTTREDHPDPLLQRFVELHDLQGRISDVGYSAKSPLVQRFLAGDQSLGLWDDVTGRLNLMRQDYDQKLKRLAEDFGIAIAGDKAASGNGPDLVRHSIDQAKINDFASLSALAKLYEGLTASTHAWNGPRPWVDG